MSISAKELNKLVKSLSSSERGYFKKNARKESHYFRLFELIIEEGEYNKKKVEQLISGAQSGAYFANQRSFLKDRILDSLQSYHFSKDKQLQLNTALANIRIFEARDLSRLRDLEIKKAFQLATQLQNFEITQSLRSRLSRNQSIANASKEEEAIDLRINEMQLAISTIELEEFSYQLCKLVDGDKSFALENSEIIHFIYNRLLSIHEQISFINKAEKLKSVIFTNLLACKAIERLFSIDLADNNTSIEFDEARKDLEGSQFPLQCTYQLLIDLESINDEQRERELLQYLIQLKDENFASAVYSSLPHCTERIIELLVTDFFNKRKYQEICSVNDALEQLVNVRYIGNETWHSSLIDTHFATIAYKISLSAMHIESYDIALNWIQAILPPTGKHTNLQEHEFGGAPVLYSTVLHLFSNNHRYLLSHLRNTKRLLERSKIECESSDFILQLLRKLTGKRHSERELLLLDKETTKLNSLTFSENSFFPMVYPELIEKMLRACYTNESEINSSLGYRLTKGLEKKSN